MKTVYCIQSTINSGHHNSYANLYCEIFVEMGYTVVLLTPQDRQDISPTLCDYQERGVFFPVSVANIDPSFAYPQATTVAPCQPSRLKGGLKNIFAPLLPAYRQIKYRLRFVIACLTHRIRGASPQRGVGWPSAQHLQSVTDMTGLKPDFIFFLYIDDYCAVQNSMLQDLCVPWAGILFYTTLLTEFSYPLYWAVSVKHCHGLCMLDERKVDAFRAQFPSKNFSSLPDVGFFALPPTPSLLSCKVQALSKGRHIILLAGALAKRKGVLTLLSIALAQKNSSLFFVFCGKMHWADFSLEERDFLTTSINTQYHNIYWHTSYLEDERELNALCSTSDVLYAVYEGTDGSSGILSKAAFFNIPIVVAEKSLMAREVLAGPMGEVANPHDTGQILAALQRAIVKRHTYHYDVYSRKVSRENLATVLRDYLG